MLFLPGTETHDLGLLLAYYLLQKAGCRVLYLGQNMPLADLAATAAYYQPDVMVTAITLAQSTDASVLIHDLAVSLPAWPLIVSGSSALGLAVASHHKITIVQNFDEFENIIRKL